MSEGQATTQSTSDLGHYLKSELLDNWAKQRKDVEAKWLRNENAYNSVTEGFWQPDWKTEEGTGWRSKTFISMTKIKVLSAYAIVIDMLLQGGMFPIELILSPWDNIVLEDLPKPQQDKVKDDIDDMTGLIQQQLLDCKSATELMKCVMAGAKFGETYWKTYIHEVTRRGFQLMNLAPQGMPELQNQNQYQKYQYFERQIKAPAFRYVSCWDMFRNMETDDMQTSQGYCERSWTSAFDLNALKGKPYYIDDAIEKVIKEHTKSVTTKPSNETTPARRKIKDPYNHLQKWEFWCRVPRKIYENFVKEVDDKADNKNLITDYTEHEMDGDEVDIGACMVENHVVRILKAKPLTRPHGRVPWEINLDDNHGIGVADNVEEAQRVLNGMIRAFEDNKKLSANVMAAIKKSLLADWSGEFKPGEIIELSEEAERASDAIAQIIFADVGESLLSGIALMERYGDELTQLPKILQGYVAEKRKVDTLGELQMLQANAGKYIGSVIKNYDTELIEPVAFRFYEYNMLDPSVQNGKGNYIVTPKGFESFNYKIIRLQKIMQGINLVMQHEGLARETKLKTLLEEIFRALDIDPQLAFKSEEEKEKETKLMAQMQATQVQQVREQMMVELRAEAEKAIAEIRAKHQAKLDEMRLEHEQELEKMSLEERKEAA